MTSSSICEITDYLKSTLNEHGKPIGYPVPDWLPVMPPNRISLQGCYCRLEPLTPEVHAAGLYSSVSVDHDEASWTYMHYGPFLSFTEFGIWLTHFCLHSDPFFYAIINLVDGKPHGFASYQRISLDHGTIEVGHVYFGPRLRRSAAATEAMFLMMQNAFLMGYRRYEWKCDALNVPSHEAARRLGFTFEGTFRQGNVYKGRNRDISWYSILDSEWVWLQRAYEEWLAPANFNRDGKQRTSLGDCILRASPIPDALSDTPGWI